MHEQKPRHNYEIVEDVGPLEAGDAIRAAAYKARDLLHAWRSRVLPDQWAEDVSVEREYPLEDGGSLRLESAAPSSMRLTHVSDKDKVPMVYDFQFTDGRGVLGMQGFPGDEEPLLVDGYDTFSRALFDCDRAEMRAATDRDT
jgi:hypothetical protein